MMVYNLELRKETMWEQKCERKKKEKKEHAEKLTDEKNLKTQATAHFFVRYEATHTTTTTLLPAYLSSK